MTSYLLLVVLLLGGLAALPLLDPNSYDAPPVAMWFMLAVAAVVMAFRSRRKG